MITSMESVDDGDHVLTGVAAEDKQAKNGESQVIAAMLILATKLGYLAVIDNKKFNQALMFGYVRTLDSNTVRPYKLILDFHATRRKIYRSTVTMEVGDYIASMKYILENPEILAS